MLKKTFSPASGFSRPRAFTLLEVLMAATIMTLISIAIFSVFSVATDSFESGNRQSQILQRGRFAIDSIERDLMNIHYLPETSYNVQARDAIETFQSDLLEAEQDNDFDDIYRIYADEDEGGDPDAPDYLGNPFEEYRLMDLQFFGTEEGDADKLVFTRKINFAPGQSYQPLGLGRVTYQVQKGFLIRSEESIFSNPRTLTGELKEKETKPSHVIVAKGVQEFELSYAFWADYTWYEVPTWESTSRQLRNSEYILGDYDFEDESDENDRNYALQPPPGSDAYNDFLNDQESQPYDGLPAYVRMKLVLADPEKPGQETKFMRIFRMPNNVEIWTPTLQLDEDQREEEVFERELEYTMIRPGAMRK